ncbi:MAG: AbrB/MazE/SpoVT family DNA-binding domain-containing protein [Desulfotomaculaceae bacterium]|nr:AbrB/MazE/SpoVT family DNA-binding domain-containing protein [Desulfotomaculaceae bacterium]MDD4766670.1 AbrB/MazE/SpoVT family DNA-binding domain-containing protein [Desulfotomaculaceae bacterium]
MYKIIVSSRGQVVIPSEIRKRLNIKEGDILSAEVEGGGRLVLKGARKDRARKGVVAQTAGLLSDMEMSGLEYVESIRKGSGRRLDEFENC